MSRPGVVLLGGNDNALSIGRALGRRGIPVWLLQQGHGSASRSKYIEGVDIGTVGPFADAALAHLQGPWGRSHHGDLLIAAEDGAIQLLLAHSTSLAEDFLLDLFNPAAARAFLDKQTTYETARDAGVPTPKFWVLEDAEDLEGVRDELVFPLIVKPRHTHVFEKLFGKKFQSVDNLAELDRALDVASEADIAVLLLERIPGRDRDLCSYYTYLDEDGSARFDFTKRIVRRNPPGMGLASAHITDDVEGIREPALKLFNAAGLLGVANVEFILDRRDDTYKLIEVNARFTASNALVYAAGIDIASIVYNRAAGLPDPQIPEQRNGLTMLDPLRDVGAFVSHRKAGQVGSLEWARSVARRHAVVGQFSSDDPMPELRRVSTRAKKVLTGLTGRS